MGILEAALEDGLSRISDEEWAALEARVRPPKPARYPANTRTGKRRSASAEVNHGN
jgi:transposase